MIIIIIHNMYINYNYLFIVKLIIFDQNVFIVIIIFIQFTVLFIPLDCHKY